MEGSFLGDRAAQPLRTFHPSLLKTNPSAEPTSSSFESVAFAISEVVDYELMALPIPTWGCDQAQPRGMGVACEGRFMFETKQDLRVS